VVGDIALMGTLQKLKKTPFYYWIILVLWPAIKDAFMASETRGRAMDVLVTIIAAIVTVYYLHLDNVNIGANFNTLINVLGVAILLRIVTNLFLIPANLYFDSRRKQDRHSWDDIHIEKRVFKLRGKTRGYGICIGSEKPFAYDVSIQMPYFEVDGYAYPDDSSLAIQGKGRRLKWLGNPHPLIASPAHIDDGGGEITFYLFDTDPNNSLYTVSCWERVQQTDAMEELIRKVESYCRGELNIQLRDSETGGVAAQEYNFEMIVDFLGNAKMKIRKGRITSYKPPILRESEKSKETPSIKKLSD
jgi:hypothetical protein